MDRRDNLPVQSGIQISYKFLTALLSKQPTSLHQWAESPSSKKSAGCQAALRAA